MGREPATESAPNSVMFPFSSLNTVYFREPCMFTNQVWLQLILFSACRKQTT